MGVRIIDEAFDVYAGDVWSQSFELGQLADPDDPDSTFTPDDLSVWPTWACMWRPSADAETEITLAVDATAAADGVLLVSATPAQTREMDDSGTFDVQASDGDSNVQTFLRCKTKWRLDVTR